MKLTYIKKDCKFCGQQYRAIDGKCLALYRMRAKLSLAKLSKVCGISTTHLCDIENGHRAVTERVVEAYKKIDN